MQDPESERSITIINGDHAETIHFTSYPKPFAVYMPNGSGHTVRGEGPTCKAKQIAKSKTPNASKAAKSIRTVIWESRKSTSLGSVAQGFLNEKSLGIK
ncbi:hypothetical protein ACFX19_040856 [Malus domestica]